MHFVVVVVDAAMHFVVVVVVVVVVALAEQWRGDSQSPLNETFLCSSPVNNIWTKVAKLFKKLSSLCEQ